MAIIITLDPGAIDAMKRPGGSVYEDMGRRALAVDSGAKIRAPVRTGRLRASGYAAPSTSVDGAWDVVFPVGYAIFVNEGTRYMRRRPFLTDALIEAVR